MKKYLLFDKSSFFHGREFSLPGVAFSDVRALPESIFGPLTILRGKGVAVCVYARRSVLIGRHVILAHQGPPNQLKH